MWLVGDIRDVACPDFWKHPFQQIRRPWECLFRDLIYAHIGVLILNWLQVKANFDLINGDL
jgi:hypothetical protein